MRWNVNEQCAQKETKYKHRQYTLRNQHSPITFTNREQISCFCLKILMMSPVTRDQSFKTHQLMAV